MDVNRTARGSATSSCGVDSDAADASFRQNGGVWPGQMIIDRTRDMVTPAPNACRHVIAPTLVLKELQPNLSLAVVAVMTSAQEHKLVAALSLLILAAYFLAASYHLRTFVPRLAPHPSAAARPIINFEKVSKNGFGFMELIRDYRPVGDLHIYEDDRLLVPATGVSEVDRVPGRFAEERGAGIALSATDGSDVRSNRHRYWVVNPEAQR